MNATRLLVIALLALLVSAGPTSAQAIGWTRQFGTTGFDVATANAVHDGAVYVLGAAGGALPGQAHFGGLDVFLRKYDLEGHEIWTRQFGTPVLDFPAIGPIGIDDTGIYVAGETDGTLSGQTSAGSRDLFVRRYDFDGNEIWTRQFGSPGFDTLPELVAGRGRVFIIGSVNGAMPGQTHGGSADAFITMYDFDGDEIWTHQFGSSGSEDLHAVALDPTNGSIYAAGSVSPLPGFAGDIDALVVKYDLDGNQLWRRQFGTVGFGDHAGGIAVRRGEIYVTGYTDAPLPGQTSAGGRDLFVRTYDAAGNEIWRRQFGTLGSDGFVVTGTAVDGRGVYVAGDVAGALPGQTSAGSADAFVRQYDEAGNELLTIQFGSPDPDRAGAISVDDSALYVSGGVGGALPGQTNLGGSDAFVVRFQKNDEYSEVASGATRGRVESLRA